MMATMSEIRSHRHPRPGISRRTRKVVPLGRVRPHVRAAICGCTLVLILCLPYSRLWSQQDSVDIFELSLTQLANIRITSASKTEEILAESAATVVVITAAEIRDRGCRTLEDVLSVLPGFQFRNIMGINSYVFQRGIPNQNNLILLLIDGVQVNELNSGGFYAGAQYNLANVDRIEVVYGPTSVAYGTNAVSGIINIITREIDGNSVEAGVLGGSFQTMRVSARGQHVTADSTFGISLAGMYATSGKGDLRGGAGDNNWSDSFENHECDYSLDLKVHACDVTLGASLIEKDASPTTLFKHAAPHTRTMGPHGTSVFSMPTSGMHVICLTPSP